MPELRPFRPADAEACRELVAEVLPPYGLKVDFDGADADLVDIPKSYAGGAFFVIEDGAHLVGMGGVRRLSADRGEVRKMYFLPEIRNQGYGRKMLDAIVAFCRANGIKTLTLETASALKEAIRLYERYGFRRDDSLLETERCDQAWRLDL